MLAFEKIPSFGIDFADIHEHASLEPGRLRESPIYLARKEEAIPYLRGWREAIKDDGYLFAVLRLSFDSHFMAFVDAAHESGWTFIKSRSTRLSVGDERFPAMTFQARQTPQASADELLAFWVEREFANSFGRLLNDSMAVIVFCALGNKYILNSKSKTFDCGHTMVTSIGTSGSLGFCFSIATTGFARLEMVPATQVGELTITFQWD